MVRAYRTIVYLKRSTLNEDYRTVINDKYNEVLQSIQERGGVILNCLPMDEGMMLFKFFVIYEDNGNFDEINSYLKDVVFALDKI
ncbi:hypothetical protein [Amedibacillus sp. YH-ame10]